MMQNWRKKRFVWHLSSDAQELAWCIIQTEEVSMPAQAIKICCVSRTFRSV